MTKRIEINAQPVEKITVNLVGTEYLMSPPKASLAMELARNTENMTEDPSKMLDLVDNWMKAAFGNSNAAKIAKRLQNPDDLLDIPHLTELMKQVIELQTGNPTT